MSTRIYEEFINTLPVACFLQKLIRDDKNHPVALAFTAINEGFINLFHMSEEDILEKHIKQLNIVDNITLKQMIEGFNCAVMNIYSLCDAYSLYTS